MTAAPVIRLAGVVPAVVLLGSLALTPALTDPVGSVTRGAVTNRSVRLASTQTVAAATAAGYGVQRVTLPDGRRVVVRFDPCQAAVTYKVNVAAVAAGSRAGVLAEIRSGVTRLGAATGITYRYRGSTTEVPRSSSIDRQSAELIVAVSTPRGTDVGIGGSTVGMGGYHYWVWQSTSSAGRTVAGAAIGRSWVVLDRDGLARLRPGFGPGATRGNVVLHELGHSVGLEHVGDRRQLMYPSLSASAPNGYAAGDLAGLALLGRRAGCLAVPGSVVADLN